MKQPFTKIHSLLIASLASISLNAHADSSSHSPFSMTPLDNGYRILAKQESKCGQNIKQENKTRQASCGEGKCGNKKTNTEAVCGIYQIGSSHKKDGKVKDGKCGGHKVVESLCGEG